MRFRDALLRAMAEAWPSLLFSEVLVIGTLSIPGISSASSLTAVVLILLLQMEVQP